MKHHVEDIRKTVRVKQSSNIVMFKKIHRKHDFKQPTMRPGKTTKDKENEVHKQNIFNKQSRDSWAKDNGRTSKNFPLYTCNGKASKPLKAKR